MFENIPTWAWWASGSILVTGIIVSLFLIFRSKFVGRKHIDDYEENRNKLTHRKKKEVEEVRDTSVLGTLSSLMTGVIILSTIAVITIFMISSLSSTFETGTATYNATTSLTSTITSLTPSIFQSAFGIVAILIMIGIIGLIIHTVHRVGEGGYA